ncbi:MAG: hypothetical protein NPIRA03_41790 [Nitrospirales bacterium]|nr:MAG: hypothetical protein NPIRA03_41790 [Nitrospirales bacterium]
MGSLLVVPSNPSIDPLLGFLEATQLMLPDALLLETSKKPFNEPILLRRVRGNTLLTQAIVSTGLSKAAALKD